MKRDLLLALLIITAVFTVYATDLKLPTGCYISTTPGSYRFFVVNDHHILLEWGGEISGGTRGTSDLTAGNPFTNVNLYNYTLSEDSLFLKIQLDSDLPTDLLDSFSGEEEREFGDTLFVLAGIASRSNTITAVTYPDYSQCKYSPFTVDMPDYTFFRHSISLNAYSILLDNPSSELKEGDLKYELNYARIITPDAPWVEGVTGNGIGESFEITFNKEPKYLCIMNGYITADNKDLYFKNGRIKALKFEGLTTGVTFTRTLKDTPHPQTIDVHELGEERKVKVSIADVYPGTRYEDTCLSYLCYSEYEITPIK